MRISHSHYLGGPPIWTAEDRAKVAAYDEWKAGVCDDCGTHEDWWLPERDGHRHAFTPNTKRCPGCEVKEQEREQIPKGEKGIHVYLEPNPELMSEVDRGR